MSSRHPTVSAWQRFYGSVLEARRRRSARDAQRLPRPVVSVGNLHWGGGGKTPLTAAIARHFRDRGYRAAILSRGHGRRSKGPLVVSRGKGAEVPARLSGDEPALLARLDGVTVVVAEQRYRAGLLALDTGDCDLFLLDDGFSHVRLARDLELLAFPAADPLGGARLLPSGRLREPLTAVRHADAVLLTGLGATTAPATNSAEKLLKTLSPYGWSGPTFSSTTRTCLGEHRPIRQALVACAVARPDSVLASARGLAEQHRFSLEGSISFSDHHAYPERSLRKIQARAEGLDTVLVTGKDMVKLQGRLQLEVGCQLVEIEQQACPQQEFVRWLDQRSKELEVSPLCP